MLLLWHSLRIEQAAGSRLAPVLHFRRNSREPLGDVLHRTLWLTATARRLAVAA